MVECKISELPKCECCHRRLECVATQSPCAYANCIVTSTASREGVQNSFVVDNCMQECPKQLFKLKGRWSNG